MDIMEGSIAAVAAVFSGFAAYAAWQAAKTANANAQKANEISESANRTAESAAQVAESIAQIERNRFHKDLTPVVEFMLTKERGYSELLVRYGGSSALGRLDRVELRVRDDRDRSRDPLSPGMTAEQRANTIWGPLRFRWGADGADELGRTVAPFSLPPGEVTRLALDPSYPHDQYGGGPSQWERDYRPKDFRLWVTVHVDGHHPWELWVDLGQHFGGGVGHSWIRAR
ncbi:hypothetical protein [Streptomyces zhihengii]|uniref:hypothetical protein n=1 Tax=Streptomyces zhihengii TaxID=1818004 RepID=UPI0033B12316